LVVILLIVGGGIAGYQAWQHYLASRPYEWSGTVEARTIQIGSRQGGRVKAVLVHEGDEVKPGQPLILLEPSDLDAQLLQAQGQLDQAEANLSKVSGRGTSSRRQEIDAARARLSAEEIAEEKAAMDLARTKKLAASGAATGQELDNADIAQRNAKAQVAAQRAQLDELLHGTPEDFKSAQGQVDVAQGRVNQIRVLLDELTIRAPLPARVETLDLRPGDILAPDQVAAKLLEPDELYVRIYVPETQLGHVHPGQQVALHVDSFPGRTFKATVEHVGSEGEFTPRNLQTADERADQVFATRLHIDEGRDVLRAGMAAFANVPK
jgi:multidrug resistance efflux pump